MDAVPISEEGFIELTNQVLDEMDDASHDAIFTRLGLPQKALPGFVARASMSIFRSYDIEPTEDMYRAMGDMVAIGIAIGHKRREWEAHATTE